MARPIGSRDALSVLLGTWLGEPFLRQIQNLAEILNRMLNSI